MEINDIGEQLLKWSGPGHPCTYELRGACVAGAVVLTKQQETIYELQNEISRLENELNEWRAKACCCNEH